MNYRIGIGYDIHRLVENRRLFIGGVEIPYTTGLLGHSDADVLLHAIADALLGAIGQGDIGMHFPDTNPVYFGISSVELLKKVCSLVRKEYYVIGNVDVVVIAQEPSLAPFKKHMQRTIAAILQMSETDVNVKAKTQEGLGEIGRKEAIAAYAVVTVHREENR